MTKRRLLLASSLLTFGAVHAAPVKKDTGNHTAPVAQPLATKEVASPHPAAAPTSREDIVVSEFRHHLTSGGGLMPRVTEPRAIQGVSQDYIAKQVPSSNVVSLLAMMPSVNSMPQDPTGILSNGIMVRGLGVDDIGWIMDGAPTLSPGAGRFQAELLDSENMERASIAPGSSSTIDPVTSSAGGTIYTGMRNPSDTRTGQVDFTYGSFNTLRGYVRLDSGLIGNSGVKAFISYSNASTQLWRGPGIAKKQHVDFKIIKNFDGGSSVALETVFNNNSNGYFYYPTADQWRTQKWVNPDATYSGITNGSYYKLNQTSSFYTGTVLAPIHMVITPEVKLDVTPYFWYGFGWGPGGTTMTQGSSYLGTQRVNVNLAQGTPGAVAKPGQQYIVSTGFGGPTYIGGLNARMEWKHRFNTFTVGYWYENYNLRELDPVSFIAQSSGEPSDVAQTHNYYKLDSGKLYYYDNYFLHYQLNALYLMDRISLMQDRLVLAGGVKDVMVTRTVDNYVPGATPHTGISENIPLPSVSGRYTFDRHNMVYVTAEGDYRQPFLGSTAEQFSPTSGALLTGATTPKSEYTIKEELGYRYNGDIIVASLSFFNMNMTNRLLTLNTYQSGVQVQREFNSGGQTSRGVDAQIGTVPLFHRFTPYMTFAYLDAKVDSNIQSTTNQGNVDLLLTKGKTQISSPHYQAGLGLSYDDGTLFGSLNLKYISSQYSTLMNDEKMPAYITNNLLIGYRLPKIGHAERPTFQINLNNLNGSTQRTGVYGFTTNARTVTGVHGGTISGGSPTYYVEPGFAAIGTLRLQFR